MPKQVLPIRLLHTLYFLTLLFAVAACQESSTGNLYSDSVLQNALPEGWEIFETLHPSEDIQRHSIITSLGALASAEIYMGAAKQNVNESEVMKRAVVASLPQHGPDNEPLFDLGEKIVSGVKGQFTRVYFGKDEEESYVIEVYLVSFENADSYLVFLTPESVLAESQDDINRFVAQMNGDQ